MFKTWTVSDFHENCKLFNWNLISKVSQRLKKV